MTLTREDWSRLERAFRRGAAVTEIRATADAQHVFHACLDAVEAGFPAGQRLRLRVMDDRRRLALSAAREGRLHAADALLDEAGAVIAAPATDPSTRVFAEAFLHAVAAYVCYRRQHWADTYRHLRLALERDDALIARRLHVLEMHRVQIAHNWMRVVARHVGDFAAAALGVALIGYLRSGGQAECWPQGVPFGRERLVRDWEAIPRELVSAMEEQITCELAVCLARLEPTCHARLVTRLADRTSTPATTAGRFITLLSARACGERGAFMETAPEFLGRGRGASTFLWEAFVFELLRCEDHPDADEWERVVRSSSVSWTYLPLMSRAGRSAVPSLVN